MQAQHEVKTGRESQEDVATDWDRLGEEIVFDPDVAEKLIQEVKSEQSEGEENAQDDKIEIVETQPAQAEGAALTPEVEKEETKEFCGLQLTKSELAEDKIIVNCGIKHRRENDRIGKALDIKRAERLLIKSLDAGGDEYGDKYIKKLTPHMVGSLIDWFKSEKSFAKPLGDNTYSQAELFKAFFEKVPLEAQAELAATQCGSNMLKEAEWYYSVNEDEKKRLRLKCFSGLAKNIKDGVLTDGEVATINREVMAGAINANEGAASFFSDFRSEVASGFVDVVLSSEKHSLFGDRKIDAVCLAVATPEDVRNQCIEKALQNTSGLDIVQATCLSRIGHGGEIPGGDSLRHVASVAASVEPGLFEKIAPKLKRIDGGSLDSIVLFFQQHGALKNDANPDARLSASDLFRGISMIGSNYISGLCEKIGKLPNDLSGEQIKNISDFFAHRNEYEMYSPEIVDKADLEHLPRLNDLCRKRVQEILSSGGNYREARNMLFERVLGGKAGQTIKDLVSFGIIELPDKYAAGGKLKGAGDKYGSNIVSFYEESKEWNPTSVDASSLEELEEKGYISKAEGAIMLAAGALFCGGAEGVAKNLFLLDEQDAGSSSNVRFAEAMKKVKESLREQSATMYTDYMKEGIEKGAVRLKDSVKYECYGILTDKERKLSEVETPVYEMRGDEFMFFTHRLGAFNSSIDKDNPAQWDSSPISYADRKKTKPLGYVSTVAICDGSLGLAGEKFGKGGYDKNEDVLYGFSDIPSKGFLYSAEYDLYTHDDERTASREKETGTLMQDFFYKSPRKIIERMKEYVAIGGGKYNEVVLNRFPGIVGSKDGRIRPNYMIVYGKSEKDISNRVKKHAAYFGVPIMLINPDKYK